MNPKTQALKKHLSELFIQSLSISSALYQLEITRRNLDLRGLMPFDKSDILTELGSLQAKVARLNREMLHIHQILEQPD